MAAKREGYGRVLVDGRTRSAHVVALEEALGRRLRPKMKGCHKCDNKPCVRPSHLFEGTQKQNVRDCVVKGRHKNPVHIGEKHHFAVLTWADVAVIRKRAVTEPYEALGKEFGIGTRHVGRIVRYERWKGHGNEEQESGPACSTG